MNLHVQLFFVTFVYRYMNIVYSFDEILATVVWTLVYVLGPRPYALYLTSCFMHNYATIMLGYLVCHDKKDRDQIYCGMPGQWP